MAVSEGSTFNFGKLTKDGVVVVDFYAPWCGPCKMLSKSLDEVSLSGRNIVKVDIDSQTKLAEKYGVMSVPTMVFLKDGVEMAREVGFRPAGAIQEIVENL